MNAVSRGYFETLQIPILRGRAFLETDTAKSTPVAMVNEKLAQQLWPNENALGKRVNVFGPKAPWIDVVGVVADSTYDEVSKTPKPYFYLPASQFFIPYQTLLVRTEGLPETMIAAVEARVRELAPTVPVWGAQTMRQTLDSSFTGFFGLRFSAILAVTVGLLGLALGSVVCMAWSPMTWAGERMRSKSASRLARGHGIFNGSYSARAWPCWWLVSFSESFARSASQL